MRRTLGMAVAAILAAGMAGLPVTTASGAPERAPDGRTAAAIRALTSHPVAARAADGQSFQAKSTLVDRDGTIHVRLDRTYQGLPVLGGDLVIHQGAHGAWQGVSQTLAAPLDLSTTPRIGPTAATKQSLVRSAVNRGIDGLTKAGKPRLVIDATGPRPHLAWAVLSHGTRNDGTPSRLTTYVDAVTGNVLRAEDDIHTVDGSGRSLYSGTVPLRLTKPAARYQLKDPTRGNTYTTDMHNTEDSVWCQLFGIGCEPGTLFTSLDNRFGNGSTSSRESAAVDAQYGTNVTWDYFKAVHGRNGIFGNGTGSYNRVHYGTNYVNAFWDGTKMTYGDGDGTNYGPLTSLDVAGHEMSHGVTENTAGLIYSGESGGLNEATSDIFGTMVEFFANNTNDRADYLIGEEFDLAQHAGFRRMDKPSSDGSSLDCWSPDAGTVDVHYSSGIGNHFFYLLAEGSGAKTLNGVSYNSPTCNGSTVTGIGRAAARKIWYRALTVYMTSSTQYAGARTATLNAARDLYGQGSTRYNAVAAAWSAVSVN